jgi:hypothetical protein
LNGFKEVHNAMDLDDSLMTLEEFDRLSWVEKILITEKLGWKMTANMDSLVRVWKEYLKLQGASMPLFSLLIYPLIHATRSIMYPRLSAI